MNLISLMQSIDSAALVQPTEIRLIGTNYLANMLRYPDQSEVCLGDRVLHNRDRAVVEALIEGDEIFDCGVDFAGFMIACERCGRVFIVPGSADWEDVSLMSRAV